MISGCYSEWVGPSFLMQVLVLGLLLLILCSHDTPTAVTSSTLKLSTDEVTLYIAISSSVYDLQSSGKILMLFCCGLIHDNCP